MLQSEKWSFLASKSIVIKGVAGVRVKMENNSFICRLIKDSLRQGDPAATATLLALQEQASGKALAPFPKDFIPAKEQTSREEPQGQEEEGILVSEPPPPYCSPRSIGASNGGKGGHSWNEHEGFALSMVMGPQVPNEASLGHRPYYSDPTMWKNHSQLSKPEVLAGRFQETEYVQPARRFSSTGIPNQCSASGGFSWQATGQEETERLLLENISLLQELERQRGKSIRLGKCEVQLFQLAEAYRGLVTTSTKREALEKSMREKLEAQLRQQVEYNKCLQEGVMEDRDALEKEVAELRAKDLEQSKLNQILETALARSQEKIARLQVEVERREDCEKRVEALQAVLMKLKEKSERRAHLECRLQQQLEQNAGNAARQEAKQQALREMAQAWCRGKEAEGITRDVESETEDVCRHLVQSKSQSAHNSNEAVLWKLKFHEESVRQEVEAKAMREQRLEAPKSQLQKEQENFHVLPRSTTACLSHRSTTTHTSSVHKEADCKNWLRAAPGRAPKVDHCGRWHLVGREPSRDSGILVGEEVTDERDSTSSELKDGVTQTDMTSELSSAASSTRSARRVGVGVEILI
uniref:angiomotin-like 2a isoform X2 n=1 Tax=Myxine glutinosa TaxID=7769 RepID=UPI00358F4EFE